jgi:hypothetical protein
MSESIEPIKLCSHLKQNPFRRDLIGVTTELGLPAWNCLMCGVRSAANNHDVYLGNLDPADRLRFRRELTKRISNRALSSRSDVVAAPAPKHAEDDSVRLLTL